MAIVFPIRFRTAEASRREAIIRALCAHGACVSAGPVDDVCEARLVTDDTLAATRRTLVAMLDREVPGWQRDATVFCCAE